MKIKIDIKTLGISCNESKSAPGFFIGELTLVSGMPPILNISHPNHKTLTEKSRIKIIFEDNDINCSHYFINKSFNKDMAMILWPDGWDHLVKIIRETEKFLKEIGVPSKLQERNIKLIKYCRAG